MGREGDIRFFASPQKGDPSLKGRDSSDWSLLGVCFAAPFFSHSMDGILSFNARFGIWQILMRAVEGTR